MQIIESTVYGVRSAVLDFEKDETFPVFTLFPMLHISEQSFYDEISQRLEQCDIILFEGVRSQNVKWLASVYMQMIRNPKHGLISQHKMRLDHVKDRLIHADVNGAEFDEKWSELSTFNRLTLPFFAPFVGYYLRWFGSKQILAKYIKLELAKDREEYFDDSDTIEREELIVDWRDKSLLRSIDEQIEVSPKGKKLRIGVIYGAKHMRAVIRHLVFHHGYRPTKAEWVMAFTV